MTDEQKTQLPGELKLPSAEELLAAGVHFGHKTSRWHPKMEQFIFADKTSIHIFDLEKTSKNLAEALNFMKGILAKGGIIVFIGTKPISKKYIKDTAQNLGMPYATERWLGGTLTNFKTITKRLQYYKDLTEQQASGGWDKYIKKERVQLQKKLTKLQGQLEGIKNLARLPDALFVADVKTDILAVREAKKTKIPVIAICDTNVDPSLIDYVIPANDDASSSIKILMETIVSNLKDIKPNPSVALAEKNMPGSENSTVPNKKGSNL